ncbi:MAG: class II glutamine amidotransferase, partial [Burkholderiales bacterium]|nr:class II glutamine amidotransferase [Burkholderiales bacterium]
NVIAHIRKATRGAVALENTHPFQRELWGRYWVFAHNGTLENFEPGCCGRFRPVGGTDSEAAFCDLLEFLWQRFGDDPPPLPALKAAITDWVPRVAAHGSFNFLLSNGDQLFAHCATKLAYIVRQAPFARASLVDTDVAVDFKQVTTPADRVAVIATEPLTHDETWTTMAPGELLVFEDGAPA